MVYFKKRYLIQTNATPSLKSGIDASTISVFNNSNETFIHLCYSRYTNSKPGIIINQKSPYRNCAPIFFVSNAHTNIFLHAYGIYKVNSNILLLAHALDEYEENKGNGKIYLDLGLNLILKFMET